MRKGKVLVVARKCFPQNFFSKYIQKNQFALLENIFFSSVFHKALMSCELAMLYIIII